MSIIKNGLVRKSSSMAADILEEYLDEHGYLTGKGI